VNRDDLGFVIAGALLGALLGYVLMAAAL